MYKIPVLKIRDKNGNLIPVNVIRGEKGQDGTNGKSAYEQAKEGGYKGTEQEFIALINGLTNDASHYSNKDNPHKVTAEQTGAIPEAYNASDDLNNELQQGGSKMKVCSYHSGTLNTPFAEGLTVFAHGMVITNAYDSTYGTQLCMPSGEDSIYVRRLNGSGTSQWVKMAYDEQLNAHIADKEKHNHASGNGGAIGKGAETNSGGAIGNAAIAASGGGAIGSVARTSAGGAIGSMAYSDSGGAIGYDAHAKSGFSGGYMAKSSVNAIQLGTGTNPNEKTLQVYDYQLMDANGLIPSERLPFASGSYKGTDTYGTKNPNTLTFDFVPKFVIVSQRGERNATGGGCFIWISSGATLNFINNGSQYWVHPTLTDQTLSWYCAESASYQLNSSNYEYDYFAWG